MFREGQHPLNPQLLHARAQPAIGLAHIENLVRTKVLNNERNGNAAVTKYGRSCFYMKYGD